MQDTLFGTYQGQHLGLGVDIYVIPALIELCHSLAQLRCTLCRLIAVCIGLVGHLTQFVDGLL